MRWYGTSSETYHSLFSASPCVPLPAHPKPNNCHVALTAFRLACDYAQS